MPAAVTSMSDTEFGKLRDIVYERSGIFFPPTKKYVLESRLSRRLDELEMDSFGQYVQFLSIGPYQNDEFQEMFNRITINETSFFRNEPQHSFFEGEVLSRLMQSRSSSKRLRVWSAACSSGEEPYTIAMQVHRTLGVRLPDWRVEILGTDISEKVLLQAQKGEYSSFSFRSVNPLVTRRYFKEEGGRFQLDPEIRSMVTFELHNLKNALAAKRHGTWDVIFCRNVMIYFDDPMKAQVVKTFYDQLADDGVLLIGHSESLRNCGCPFVTVNRPQAFAYVKEGSGVA